jgi:DNA-directed RNA polymerase subunit beta'
VKGRVEFGNDYKAKRRIRVVPTNGDLDAVEYLLPKGRPLAVNEGDVVRKGDLLLDGSPVPHDILSILGVEALAEYLVKEVQDVYRLQGVKIDDKHIEVIVRQMLQKVEVEDAADSTFLNGEQVDREEFAQCQYRLLKPKVCGQLQRIQSCLASPRHHCRQTALSQLRHSKRQQGC